jgi:Nitroreductase family
MNRDTLLKILDSARWAPSGDNTQPWRFELVSDCHIAVHGHDTRRHVVYDFDGHASHIAHGALLETLRLAASRFGLRTEWRLRQDCTDTAPIYDVRLEPQACPPNPLASFIEQRAVQRRAMRASPLPDTARQMMAQAAGPAFQLKFFESWTERMAVASLLWRNAYVRLTCPEAFPVHRSVIEWHARFSHDRIPERAVGVDPLTGRLMHWAMKDWRRVEFLNRYLMGTVLPRIQLDLLPAIWCSAHVLLVPRRPLTSLPDFVAAGEAIQRLWLTATSLQLQLQPEMTPVIFRWYVQAGRPLSRNETVNRLLPPLAKRFEALTNSTSQEAFAFFCRIGTSFPPKARSLRKQLKELMVGQPVGD